MSKKPNRELCRRFVEYLRSLEGERDTEKKHSAADLELCNLLQELGYGKVVEAYKKLRKWYS